MMDTYKWVADKWSTQTQVSPDEVKTVTETGKDFLVVWSLYEQKCFGGFCHKNGLSTVASAQTFDLTPIENNIKTLHDRYTGENEDQLYDSLIYYETKNALAKIQNIRNTPFDQLSREEKLLFALFVVLRFRNNIFHGNKAAKEWCYPENQRNISLCIEIMKYCYDNWTS